MPVMQDRRIGIRQPDPARSRRQPRAGDPGTGLVWSCTGRAGAAGSVRRLATSADGHRADSAPGARSPGPYSCGHNGRGRRGPRSAPAVRGNASAGSGSSSARHAGDRRGSHTGDCHTGGYHIGRRGTRAGPGDSHGGRAMTGDPGNGDVRAPAGGDHNAVSEAFSHCPVRSAWRLAG